MDRIAEGETRVFERTFTVEEVRAFADLSGDAQPRHTEPDDDGRVMVHGLLTATLPTKIGGDLQALGRSVAFDFHRPVYTGERITCSLTVESVADHGDRCEFTTDVVCENAAGEPVLTGSIEGLVTADE
ncbi:MaoC family dehydratase [Halovivax limisalsi]|uniref:MaoC family dehydratase n=1 Tax=Halovivax limisalsi TaxID=1453760 RepID=UPI001FFDB171|nr:MaoC family dehydratase N-terminal domain-containing protein [Halovivax limisalsi]